LTSPPEDLPEVHYLTQQFVDRLCSSEAESDELLEEIKRVVFLAHEPESRLGAHDFDTLAELKSSATRRAVAALEQQLDELSQDLFIERSWYRRRGPLQRDLTKAIGDLQKTEAARQNLIKPRGKDRAEYYTRLGAEITSRQKRIQGLDRQLQSYRKLGLEVERYRTQVLPRVVQEIRQSFEPGILTEGEWEQFVPQFAGDHRPHRTLCQSPPAGRELPPLWRRMPGPATGPARRPDPRICPGRIGRLHTRSPVCLLM
jgi:hypothetical protein